MNLLIVTLKKVIMCLIFVVLIVLCVFTCSFSLLGQEKRKFLTLDQLLKMKQLREQEVDLQHIGILFLLDKGLKVVFFFPFFFVSFVLFNSCVS